MISRSPQIAHSLHTRVAGVMMHAVVVGENIPADSPDFVLVHGLGMSGRYMMPTAERLAAHGRVWVPDLPGFGASTPPRIPSCPNPGSNKLPA